MMEQKYIIEEVSQKAEHQSQLPSSLVNIKLNNDISESIQIKNQASCLKRSWQNQTLQTSQQRNNGLRLSHDLIDSQKSLNITNLKDEGYILKPVFNNIQRQLLLNEQLGKSNQFQTKKQNQSFKARNQSKQPIMQKVLSKSKHNIKKIEQTQVKILQNNIAMNQSIITPKKKNMQTQIVSPHKKPFTVPITNNLNGHNRHKYEAMEYSPLKDDYLTNYFVTNGKKQYISRILQPKLHQKEKSMSSSHITTSKGISRIADQLLQLRKEKKYILQSIVNVQQKTAFDKTKNQNSKFVVKTLPSQKLKHFFNLSLSTFVNHNYQPQTLRGSKSIKQRKPMQQIKQIKQYDAQHVQISKLVYLDQISKQNSSKPMSKNSIKSKKIKLPLQRASTSQNSLNPNLLKVTISTSRQPFFVIPRQKQQKSQQKSLSVNKNYKPIQQNNINYSKVSHFKKRMKMERHVMGKIGMVIKMGVKIPMITKKIYQQDYQHTQNKQISHINHISQEQWAQSQPIR